MKIPITKPLFGPDELRAVQLPLESGWVVQGPFVKQFEEKVAAFARVPFAVATSSCTAALHVSVAALDLRPGDEVIVPAFTWVATANVVEHMGARPVFCDIDLATFNIDVERIESLITPRTVGIMPVHLFGLPADMEAIMDIAGRHGLWVVEDAACALGTWYHGQHAGTMGDAGCFSFHPRKCVTTGEGGMIVTNQAKLAERAWSLRDHGGSRSDLERHSSKKSFRMAEYNLLGFNYRLTDIQGALGAAQMDRLEEVLTQRRRRAEQYYRELAEIGWLRLPTTLPDCIHAYQSFVCLFQPEPPSLEDNVDRLHERRNALLRELENRDIMTRPGTHAVALQGYYVRKYGYTPADFPNAWLADRLSFTLPLYPQMSDTEQGWVITRLRAARVAGE